MFSISQFDYNLPSNLIAQTPSSPRDHSQLMLIDRDTQQISHHHFFDLPQILANLDQPILLIRNNTKVIPARIFGSKNTGGKVELLLTRKLKIESDGDTWECLTKPGLKIGQQVFFDNNLQGTCLKINDFARTIKFNQTGLKLLNSLKKIGHTPIPPYIKWHHNDEGQLRKKYQTTFAKIAGSAAAPTAGLHFTEQLDNKLKKAGVEILELTLHVGLGTFLPVLSHQIENKKLHTETYSITPEIITKIIDTKNQGTKIIAVGTTTTRALESYFKNYFSTKKNHSLPTNYLSSTTQICQDNNTQYATDLFIYPPHKFQIVSGMITNFHLPKTSLLMMISAFISHPNTKHKFINFTDSLIGRAYQKAIENNYRFFSFGDGMLIL